MPDPITLKSLLADEDLLRREAGRVLKPGPWEHKWGVLACLKCHCSRSGNTRDNYKPHDCPVPDPATGPLEVIAEQLVKKCNKGLLLRVCTRMSGPTEEVYWFAFIATVEQRIVVCLKALDTEGRYSNG